MKVKNHNKIVIFPAFKFLLQKALNHSNKQAGKIKKNKPKIRQETNKFKMMNRNGFK